MADDISHWICLPSDWNILSAQFRSELEAVEEPKKLGHLKGFAEVQA